MRWLFFDDILERHVAASLARALRTRGHDVVETGPVWRGHALPSLKQDRTSIFEQLERALACEPDIMLVFRATTLTPEHLKWLLAKPVVTMVWLPDDPVLYRSYGQVVDFYDFVLHGGGDENLLGFYDRRGHRPGFVLPFWAAHDRFPFVYRPSDATDGDFVFFGNCVGPSKAGRYRTIERFAEASDTRDVAIYGRVENDPHNWGRGYVEEEEEQIKRLAKFRMTLNIPQRFADYRGTAHYFSGLVDLGYFDVASRVVQLGSLGLPQVAIGPAAPSVHFPTLVWGDGRVADKWTFKPQILADREALTALSAYGRRQFEKNFTADARAEFLVELVNGEIRPDDVRSRCFAYRRSPLESPTW